MSQSLITLYRNIMVLKIKDISKLASKERLLQPINQQNSWVCFNLTRSLDSKVKYNKLLDVKYCYRKNYKEMMKVQSAKKDLKHILNT